MPIPKTPLIAAVMRFAGGLKFKQLFLLTGGLFILDLLIPDIIPFADELILGLLTLLFSLWKKDDEPQPSASRDNVIEGEVVDKEK